MRITHSNGNYEIEENGNMLILWADSGLAVNGNEMYIPSFLANAMRIAIHNEISENLDRGI